MIHWGDIHGRSNETNKKDLKHFYYTRIKHLTDREIQQNYLRSLGMKIGNECYIFSDKIETAEPYLVSLGDHVTIANDVRFATHDASANFYIEGASDIYGRISIGNYVFIGMGTIILPGVTIADHCIIAAGSVVTKSFFEDGVVIGGNPAHLIGTVEELKEKNKNLKLYTWGMSYSEKRTYLEKNEESFKHFNRER